MSTWLVLFTHTNLQDDVQALGPASTSAHLNLPNNSDEDDRCSIAISSLSIDDQSAEGMELLDGEHEGGYDSECSVSHISCATDESDREDALHKVSCSH